MKLKPLVASLLVVCILSPVLAQTKPAAPAQPPQTGDDEVVRITTNLVQIDAVVTKDGKPVPNLTADDFEIYEDGRRQTITNFAFISNVPGTTSQPARQKSPDSVPFTPLKPDDARRTLALVVDDLGLSAESMYQVRRQLRKFIAEDLHANDLVAILRTSGEMGALQQFTNDRRLLNRAVDQLRWNFCSRVGVNIFPALRHPSFSVLDDESQCSARSYYQTMKALRFILDAMGQLPGRKAMVILSDSLPRETQEGLSELRPTGSINYSALLQRVAEKAIRSSVVIYSVDTQGLQYTGPTAADRMPVSGPQIPAAMNQVIAARTQLLYSRREGGELIATQTGGFQVHNSNSFQLDRVLEDQSGYYLLGYRPTDETFNKRFHHIKAKLKRSGMTLRTRFGFYGVSEEEASQSRPSFRDSTNLALASPFRAQDVEVGLTSFFMDDKAAGPLVRSFVYIGAKDLAFNLIDDRHSAAIELHGVIFGDSGVVVEELTRGLTFSLSDSDYRQALNNGMALTFDMPVRRPGFYQVRVAARDSTSSRIGSAGQFVAVPDLQNRKPAVSGIVLGATPMDPSQAIATAGAKRFAANDNLYFAYVIYNASQFANVVMQAKLFRDGKDVYSGPEVPIRTANQPDPNRVFASGVLRLSDHLEPGNYYLEVIITDKGGKNKIAPLMQWIDFEIVK